jgi:FkbH-like protein
LLRPEHISAHAISWDRKAEGLRTIARNLRIGLDSILYIDDNPGELAAICEELPQIKVIHAGADPTVTVNALRDYPGLHKWRIDDADQRRIADLSIAETRLKEAERQSDPREYLRSLRIQIRFRTNDQNDSERLQSLSNKTNQFNLSLRRLRASDVAQYMAQPEKAAIAVELSDRLSNSGLIGAVFLTVSDDVCQIDEVCISCRALGRGLEDLIVLGAIKAGLDSRRAPEIIRFEYSKGPRNAPARDWLERLSGEPLRKDDGSASVTWQQCYRHFSELESLLGVRTVGMELDG